MSGDFQIIDYSPEHLDALIPMWRESFELAVGIVDPHPIEEQRDYFENKVLPNNRVRIVIADDGSLIGFMASTREVIAQLYVRVSAQRRGVGSALLGLAKSESSGRLRLFTFASNDTAQEFYRRNGFREVRRGFEAEWGLEDIELEWQRERDTERRG